MNVQQANTLGEHLRSPSFYNDTKGMTRDPMGVRRDPIKSMRTKGSVERDEYMNSKIKIEKLI